MHPMRRHDREMPPEAVRELILNHNAAVVSMVDGDRPYAVMMNYAPEWKEDGTLAFYFHCAQSGRKITCLKTNPHVSIFIHDISRTRVIPAESCPKWTTAYASVAAFGKISFLEGISKVRAAEHFMRYYAPETASVPESALEQTLFLRLDIEMLTGKANLQK